MEDSWCVSILEKLLRLFEAEFCPLCCVVDSAFFIISTENKIIHANIANGYQCSDCLSYLKDSHLENIGLSVMILDYLQDRKLFDSPIIIFSQNRILETLNDFIYILIFNFGRYTSGILSADSEPYCQWTS